MVVFQQHGPCPNRNFRIERDVVIGEPQPLEKQLRLVPVSLQMSDFCQIVLIAPNPDQRVVELYRVDDYGPIVPSATPPEPAPDDTPPSGCNL